MIAGYAGNHPGSLVEGFSVGQAEGEAGSSVGGMTAVTPGSPFKHAFWDRQTSGLLTSSGGVARTTAQLQAALQSGFKPDAWSITPGFSYPYLIPDNPGGFASTLATTVVGTAVFTFVPIGQLEPTEYKKPPDNAEKASLAAVYTMIARAIGLTKSLAGLIQVKIDKHFWDDATETATFSGPVTGHATLGALVSIDAGTPIGDANVIGALKQRRVAIIRGNFQRPNGGLSLHWMLATLFTTEGGTLSELVANDPFTGQQVRIDPNSKQVVSPANFPLANFTVDRFQAVTLN
jgi:hypothetical protein